jgi:hypothetical protein
MELMPDFESSATKTASMENILNFAHHHLLSTSATVCERYAVANAPLVPQQSAAVLGSIE